MRNITFISICVFCFAVGAQAQDYIKLLDSKDYSAVESHMNSKIVLEIDREKSQVSAATAAKMMREKLNAFGPKKWERVHKGSSKQDDANYFIAKVYNASGDGLRVFFHLESAGSAKKISSIRIRNLLK
jgi:hypothetical protein